MGEWALPGCTVSPFAVKKPSRLALVAGKLFCSPADFFPFGIPIKEKCWAFLIPIPLGRTSELTFDLIFLSCRLTLDLSFFKKSGLLFDFIISGKKQKKWD